MIADLADLMQWRADRRFGTVLADPPWPSKSRRGTGQGDSGHWLKDHTKPRYGTMKEADIAGLPVDAIAADDAVLVMWTTWMHLPMAFRVMEAWGFRYATGMPWLKVTERGIEAGRIEPIYGPGVWFQHCTELILIGRRGSPFGKLGNPRPARKGIVIAPRQEHSRKPDEVHEWVERAGFPQPRLELFARREREGWTAWGNEL